MTNPEAILPILNIHLNGYNRPTYLGLHFPHPPQLLCWQRSGEIRQIGDERCAIGDTRGWEEPDGIH